MKRTVHNLVNLLNQIKPIYNKSIMNILISLINKMDRKLNLHQFQ
jgi:hypothetical protein